MIIIRNEVLTVKNRKRTEAFSLAEEIIYSMANEGISEVDIRRKLENEDEFKEIYLKFIKNRAEQYFDFFSENLEKIAKTERKDERIFTKHLHDIWGYCFKLTDVLYVIATETAIDFQKFMNSETNDIRENYQYRYNALMVIHGRCLQIFKEVNCLCKNGFADGALARWRTMYELCVVAFFISNNGEEVAKAFAESGRIENNEYYNWALVSQDFKNIKKVKFADLQRFYLEKYDNIWKKQYSFSSKIVHASSIATYDRISSKSILECIPIGESDYGINIPAEHSALILLQVTKILILLYPNEEAYMHYFLMEKWVELTRNEYISIDNSTFI